MTDEIIILEDKIPSSNELREKGLTDEGIANFKDFFYQRSRAKTIENSATPPEITKEREGFKDRKTGQPVLLEFVPEDYCLSELNRLYPGWWTEDMKRSSLQEIIELQTVVTEGYLCVQYPLLSGRIHVEKRWAIADNGITFEKGTKIPVDIGNNFKGSKTEWLRNACKWYGIGLDIYHQNITPALRSMFEDRIRDWSEYATYWVELAKNANKGKTFRDMLKIMPTMEQVKVAQLLISKFPESEQPQVWKIFGTHHNATEEAKVKLEEWLEKIQKIVAKNFS